MSRPYRRLTQPLVREGGSCVRRHGTRRSTARPPGLRATVDRHGPRAFGMFSCSKTHERDELRGPEVRPRRDRQQQHRQLQPYLTRPERRRSGDGVRGRWGHELLPGDRGDRRHPPLGVERARDAPDLLPPPPEGHPQRGAALRHRPAAHQLRAVGRRLARPGRRLRHRAGQRRGPRDHRRRARESRVHRARHDGLRGVRSRPSSRTRSRTPSARRACPRARSARWRTPTPAPTGDDLLDAGHHRAPQRRRQRARADQPGPADRARGPLRLGPQSAARAEQRPGRRRHGRAARPAARLPARRERRVPREVRARAGASPIPPKRGWHLSEMFEAMERGELRALYVIGENPLQSEADQTADAGTARGPRLPRRAGHLPHRDRRDGRRRASRPPPAGASRKGR